MFQIQKYKWVHSQVAAETCGTPG